MRLFVKLPLKAKIDGETMSWKTFTIDVEPFDTIEVVKEKI
jgi:hypothetical protein